MLAYQAVELRDWRLDTCLGYIPHLNAALQQSPANTHFKPLVLINSGIHDNSRL